MLTPRRPARPGVPRRAARPRARLLPGRRLRRARAAGPRSTCPRHGWVNLHFSLLPAWRGAAPVQAALRHGDDITGATTFRLEEGLDTGPVFGVVTEAVAPTDTAGDAAAPARRLRRRAAARPRSTASRTARLVPAPAAVRRRVARPEGRRWRDARVDWAAPPTAVDRLVRSVTPDPGAWTTFRGERLGLGPVRPADPAGAARAQARRAARREAAGAGRAPATRRWCSARSGPSGKPPDAGRRLGARRAHRRPARCSDERCPTAASHGPTGGGDAMAAVRRPPRAAGRAADRRPATAGSGAARARRAADRGRRGRRGAGARPGPAGRLELLTAVRVRDAYANLALPGDPAAPRAARPRRRAGHRARLRHAARPAGCSTP